MSTFGAPHTDEWDDDGDVGTPGPSGEPAVLAAWRRALSFGRPLVEEYQHSTVYIQAVWRKSPLHFLVFVALTLLVLATLATVAYVAWRLRHQIAEAVRVRTLAFTRRVLQAPGGDGSGGSRGKDKEG